MNGWFEHAEHERNARYDDVHERFAATMADLRRYDESEAYFSDMANPAACEANFWAAVEAGETSPR